MEFCLGLPTLHYPLTGKPLVRDPDFPDYLQLPREYLQPDNDLGSLGAQSTTTVVGREPNNTVSPLTTSGAQANTATSTGRSPVRCSRLKEKELIEMLQWTGIEALRPFTPISFCANRKQRRRIFPPPHHDNRTPDTQQRTRYNFPTSCGERMIGRGTQCPHKLTCNYDANRYPPLMYTVTCLEPESSRGYRRPSYFSCPTCSIVTEWVWVLRLVDAGTCTSDGKEVWVPKQELAQRGCGCRAPFVRPFIMTNGH